MRRRNLEVPAIPKTGDLLPLVSQVARGVAFEQLLNRNQAFGNGADKIIPGFQPGKCQLDEQCNCARHRRLPKDPKRAFHLELRRYVHIPN